MSLSNHWNISFEHLLSRDYLYKLPNKSWIELYLPPFNRSQLCDCPSTRLDSHDFVIFILFIIFHVHMMRVSTHVHVRGQLRICSFLSPWGQSNLGYQAWQPLYPLNSPTPTPLPLTFLGRVEDLRKRRTWSPLHQWDLFCQKNASTCKFVAASNLPFLQARGICSCFWVTGLWWWWGFDTCEAQGMSDVL